MLGTGWVIQSFREMGIREEKQVWTEPNESLGGKIQARRNEGLTQSRSQHLDIEFEELLKHITVKILTPNPLEIIAVIICYCRDNYSSGNTGPIWKFYTQTPSTDKDRFESILNKQNMVKKTLFKTQTD